MKKLMNILFYAVSIFLILFIFFEVFMPNKTIDYLGIKTYIVLTPSMEPDINVDDMIIVRKIDEEDIEVGDAISFEVYIRDLGREAVVTHYVGDIIEIDGELIYETRGAQAEDGVYDQWMDEENQEIDITYDDIIGKLLFRLPYLGHAVKIVRSPVMLGLLGLNVIILYALVRVIKHKPKNQQ
ncbi:MAG: signal peptidase I [Candidatus Izemoplasmataceae bacterium]